MWWKCSPNSPTDFRNIFPQDIHEEGSHNLDLQEHSVGVMGDYLRRFFGVDWSVVHGGNHSSFSFQCHGFVPSEKLIPLRHLPTASMAYFLGHTFSKYQRQLVTITDGTPLEYKDNFWKARQMFYARNHYMDTFFSPSYIYIFY